MTTNSTTQSKIIILGSGAAPGVPSVSWGWGACDPNNPKNTRTRAATYLEYKGLKLLLDSGPDLRQQMLDHNIRFLDAVLYSHAHSDHINGFDDLREITRLMKKPLNIYGNKHTIKDIKKKFNYGFSKPRPDNDYSITPHMIANIIKANHSFFIKNVKITPIKLLEHTMECIGYVFDDGEFIYIADFKSFASSTFKMITKKPELMVMPLTMISGSYKHANLPQVLEYITIINPKRVILNHMSTECDYDKVNELTPDNVFPAYDGMEEEF